MDDTAGTVFASVQMKFFLKYDFSDIIQDNETLCQIVLDPNSMNLSRRIHMNDELLCAFFKISREFCSCIGDLRVKMLNEKLKNRE